MLLVANFISDHAYAQNSSFTRPKVILDSPLGDLGMGKSNSYKPNDFIRDHISEAEVSANGETTLNALEGALMDANSVLEKEELDLERAVSDIVEVQVCNFFFFVKCLGTTVLVCILIFGPSETKWNRSKYIKDLPCFHIDKICQFFGWLDVYLGLPIEMTCLACQIKWWKRNCLRELLGSSCFGLWSSSVLP